MSLRVSMEFKKLFFDRGRVINRVTRERRKALSRIGAYTMKVARSSMRRSKKSSLPGKPPRAHSGELKRLIYFNYDPQRDSVVIGPVGFKNSNVPEVLEYGGTARVKGRGGEKSRVRIQARPYMGPAEQKAHEYIPEAFQDLIKTR